MIEYETVWMRIAVLVARTSTIGVAAPGATQASGLREYVLTHVKRILVGLRRDLDDADTVVSDSGRATLQRVAVGKAACGIAALEDDHRLVHATPSDSRVPRLRFSIACRTLLLALHDAQSGCDESPELPSLAGRFTTRERRERGADATVEAPTGSRTFSSGLGSSFSPGASERGRS